MLRAAHGGEGGIGARAWPGRGGIVCRSRFASFQQRRLPAGTLLATVQRIETEELRLWHWCLTDGSECVRTSAGPANAVTVRIGGNLRVILPLVQMALAALLLRLSFLYDVATRHHDMPGVHPGFVLLQLINLPVSLPLKLLRPRQEPPLWLGVLSVLIIGLLWYGIASWTLVYRERRTLFPSDRSDRAWVRVSTDLLLIAMGATFGWAVLTEFRDYPFMISPSHFGGWFWFAPVCIFAIFWIVGSILVFGYDLTDFVRHVTARA